MVLIDRVLDYEPGKRLTAISAVSGTSDWSQGHFPGRAIYPGTHIIQGFSQTAILLLLLSSSPLLDDEVTVVSSVDARFLGVVVPGDTLTYETHLDRVVSGVFFCRGSAARNSQIVSRLRVRVVRREVASLGEPLW
jgi:3-hydroxyacyl-[acyl-carrier-protein] dehydratase